jgi:hypothetical protein
MDKKISNNKKEICISGKLYCIYNEVHKFYGDNIYKLGNSKDITKRLNGYTTYYIKPCEIKIESAIFRNKNLAENILFILLKEYRISGSREFFKCDIEIIKEKIKEIEELFKKYDNNELENLYFPKTKIQIKDNKYNFIKKIFNAEDIDNLTYINISNKIINNKATDNEKYCYYKYGFINYWKLKILTIELLEENFKIENVVNKLLYLYDKQLIGSKYCDNNINEKSNIIKDMIKILGFDLYNLEIKLNRETYYENVKKLLNDSSFEKNYDKIKILFGKSKEKLNNNMKGSGLAIFLNNFMEHFGLHIKCKHTTITINKKQSNVYTYLMEVIDKYKDYLITKTNIKETKYNNKILQSASIQSEEEINGKVYKIAKLIKK